PGLAQPLLTLDGGSGNDTILGSTGVDALMGGDGDDQVEGSWGNDTISLGAGNDVFVWNPGGGSDVVDGQAGLDTMLFTGATFAETISIAANGSHVLLSRDVGVVAMDINSIEHFRLTLQGGADTVVINDLAGTGVKQVDFDLGLSGVGDGQV